MFPNCRPRVALWSLLPLASMEVLVSEVFFALAWSDSFWVVAMLPFVAVVPLLVADPPLVTEVLLHLILAVAEFLPPALDPVRDPALQGVLSHPPTASSLPMESSPSDKE